MKHDMNLWHDSFTAIRERTKTIEMRLYDEKRSKIKIGDSVSIGYSKGEDADPDDMLQYYSKDMIEKYGVVGIELSLV